MWQHKEILTGSNPNVMKFIFRNEDAIAESVLYQYPTFKDRTVMCVSTQTGCPMGCSFCGTGKFFGRNLRADEIVNQVQYMLEMFDVPLNDVIRSQIMFMSMGEPLLNMDEMVGALLFLANEYPRTALLISTSGPKTSGWIDFMDIAERYPQIGLQFSVHESTDEARNKLIPFRHKFTLEQIANHGEAWHNLTGRKPFFNYCVHEGNCSDADVTRLTLLFDPKVWECTLSVVCEADSNMADAVNHNLDMINEFSGKLVARGFNTRVFNPAGQDDIGGGCGQLVVIRTAINDAHNLALIHNGHANDGGHFFGCHAHKPHRACFALHAVDKIGALGKIIADGAAEFLGIALFAVNNNLAVRGNEPACGNVAVDGGKILKGVYGVEKKLVIMINGGIFGIRL